MLGVGVNLNVDKDKLSLVKDKEITALNLELSREYEDKKLFTEKLLREFFKIMIIFFIVDSLLYEMNTLRDAVF